VQTKAAETQATRAKYQAPQRFETAGWNHSGDYSGGADALEDTSPAETQEELEQLKRNIRARAGEGEVFFTTPYPCSCAKRLRIHLSEES